MGYKKLIDSDNYEPENILVVDDALKQIVKLGGTLHFKIEKDNEGWTAQCKEVNGIVTGGSNLNPSDFEIEERVRDAIHTAFNISVKALSPEKLKGSVSELALSV